MPKRVRLKTTEHAEQVAYFDWVKLMQNQKPELACVFAVPNAGKRSVGACRYYLAEGLRPGVPDIIGMIPKGKYHGFVIEMKVKPNKLTELQHGWLSRLDAQGYAVAVCYSADDAIAFTKAYLNGGFDAGNREG